MRNGREWKRVEEERGGRKERNKRFLTSDTLERVSILLGRICVLLKFYKLFRGVCTPLNTLIRSSLKLTVKITHTA